MTEDSKPDSKQNEYYILLEKAGEVIQSTTEIFSKDNQSGILTINEFERIQSLTKKLQDFMISCKTVEAKLNYERSNPVKRLKDATEEYQRLKLSEDVLEYIRFQSTVVIQATIKVLRHGFSGYIKHNYPNFSRNINYREHLAEEISEMMGLIMACGINSNIDASHEH